MKQTVQIKRKPKYYQLYCHIKDLIKQGKFVENQVLPGDNELMSTFNLSRSSVRQAMGELVNAGMISRHKGAGSFVRNKSSWNIDGNNTQKTFLIVAKYPISAKENSFYAELLYGFLNAQMSNNISIHICCEDEFDLEFRKTYDVIVFWGGGPSKRYDEIAPKTPIVYLDYEGPDIPNSATVCSPNIVASEALVQSLLRQNHSPEKIGFVAFGQPNNSLLRLEGFKKALENCGGYCEDLIWIDMHAEWQDLVDSVKQGKMTALFAANDSLALYIANLMLKNGISLPKDLQIVSYDGSSLLNLLSSSIDYIRIFPKVMALKTIDVALKLLNSKHPMQMRIEVGYELITHK